MSRFALALRLARRELRSGLSGFRIFFACLVLGVAAIAGVGSLAQAMLTGLASQGRELLGGDVSVELVHRTATSAEHAFLSHYGRVSQTASMRAMAYALKGGEEGERQLIELKAVDSAYPLYGSAGLSIRASLQTLLQCSNESFHPPLGGGGKNPSRARNFSRRGFTKAFDPSPKFAAQISTLPQGEGGIAS